MVLEKVLMVIEPLCKVQVLVVIEALCKVQVLVVIEPLCKVRVLVVIEPMCKVQVYRALCGDGALRVILERRPLCLGCRAQAPSAWTGSPGLCRLKG